MSSIFWTKALSVFKTYGVIVTAITVISTAAVKIDRKKQNDTRIEKDLNELIDTTHYYFNDVNWKLDRIERSISILNAKVENQGSAIESTQASFKNYVLRDKTLSAKEFYEYMNKLEYENKLSYDSIMLVNLPKDYEPKITVRKK